MFVACASRVLHQRYEKGLPAMGPSLSPRTWSIWLRVRRWLVDVFRPTGALFPPLVAVELVYLVTWVLTFAEPGQLLPSPDRWPGALAWLGRAQIEVALAYPLAALSHRWGWSAGRAVSGGSLALGLAIFIAIAADVAPATGSREPASWEGWHPLLAWGESLLQLYVIASVFAFVRGLWYGIAGWLVIPTTLVPDTMPTTIEGESWIVRAVVRGTAYSIAFLFPLAGFLIGSVKLASRGDDAHIGLRYVALGLVNPFVLVGIVVVRRLVGGAW
jgi:hypothetical protein